MRFLCLIGLHHMAERPHGWSSTCTHCGKTWNAMGFWDDTVKSPEDKDITEVIQEELKRLR
jgi:hypothetical protein